MPPCAACFIYYSTSTCLSKGIALLLVVSPPPCQLFWTCMHHCPIYHSTHNISSHGKCAAAYALAQSILFIYTELSILKAHTDRKPTGLPYLASSSSKLHTYSLSTVIHTSTPRIHTTYTHAYPPLPGPLATTNVSYYSTPIKFGLLFSYQNYTYLHT